MGVSQVLIGIYRTALSLTRFLFIETIETYRKDTYG